jgi:YtkA-like
MYGTMGDDDDCKYHVSWTATPIYENYNVYFMVVATSLTTMQAVTGANIFAEVYLNDSHTAPPTMQSAVENPPGTYKVGPIQFDEPGTWTVRFHLFENCLDYADDSPHGHAAFYIDVP